MTASFSFSLSSLRRLPVVASLLTSLLLSGHAVADEKAPEQLRIAYQKGSVGLVLAKSHKLLETRFPNTKITWIEFPAGPQILEALNVGSIDLGGTGDLPPLFAQAAGADLLYIGSDQPVYLTPADARAAFQQHDVDAWAIWDPYYSAAQVQGKVRVLTDGSSLHQTGSFYLAPKKYTEANPQFIQQVLTVLTQANALTKTDREQSIKLLSQSMGLPEKVVASYLDHLPDLPITPVSAETEKRQQQTADLFYQNHILPKPVEIKDRIWKPAVQAN